MIIKVCKRLCLYRVQNYSKGAIYLKNISNLRKSTASFYTPDLISILYEEALNDENILSFILDNTCGRGHFDRELKCPY